MSKRTFRPKEKDEYDPEQAERRLTQEPVAVYYRQSTTAQVGNISTAIQTIDMVGELKRRGWKEDDIILIDDDEGVSGTKRIDEREGMSYLFELITERKIGAVACQDEDRLFRDMTQIQVNIFIDTCRKSKIKVITPFFTYDFAHPHHGEFHARQFRFKCDMAAEYLNSYVVGRLAAARQRLMRDGKWAGARIPVGYMVDMRKRLPDGTENPNWRKFVPFEPYAEIVRAYFRIFLENNREIRKTMRAIRDQGLSFPTCKPPEGFKASTQFKKRADGYYINRGNFVALLTNPVYIGHWCYKGVVTCWNNHAPLVDVDTYMKVFNSLSSYTLTGEENPDYQPAYQYVRPEVDKERPVDRPLLAGLIYTNVDDRWYKTGVTYEKRNQCYLYVQHKVEIEGTVIEWARRAAWIDEAIIGRFKQKLEATFQSETWAQALQDEQALIDRNHKIRRRQLSSLEEEMRNLVTSLKTLTHPYLIKEVEERYSQMEQEHKRLETEIAKMELESRHHISIEKASELFEYAVNQWDAITQDERRNLLGLFIERIEASDYNRSGEMKLRIGWKDNSSEEVQLWHKPHSSHWSFENVEKLLRLFDKGSSQLEIASAFPELKWYQIFNEIKKHRGLIRFSPVYLGKQETYTDYQKRGGGKGKSTPSKWQPEEEEKLKEMVETGATQIEIMQEFPYRKWIRIQERISRLLGKGIRVKRVGSGIPQKVSYNEYVGKNINVNSECCSESAAHCS